MASASGSPASIAFGRFRVLPQRRELLADGQPVKLGQRAFDLLLALIEARGTVLGKDALMRRVWPDRIVEENNLQAQISALRAAFGAERRLIRTVAGRGYQFTGEIDGLPAGLAGAAPAPAAIAPPTNLAEPVSELIGRDDEVDEIVRLAGDCRLVTLTGPGGIGKTRLALAAARRLLAHFADGVWLAEFSPLADPGLVPATVSAAVGLALTNGDASPQRVAQALADRRVLLVLDTCEHVVAAAAALAEAVLHAGAGVRLIATSREPLRAEGEQLYPVPPLAAPAATAGDPWRYGAVRLFAVRSRASGAQVPDHPGAAAAIAAICRRLEGMPLAIELAAARTASLGLDELALRLDDRFRLLTGGRRTALPRHQTLRATLDWSHELLAEPERVVLRRLAVFAGPFGLEAAAAVAGGADLAPSDVVEALSNLVAKSLAATEAEAAGARYRLLDTTRAYALEKLGESGERPAAAGRHAAYYRELFERAEAEWQARPTAEWLGAYGRQIDNLRAALDWAFGPEGDAAAGVALTAAAVPLWLHLSLLEECRGRIERALAALAGGAPSDPRREMKLHAALGAALIFTQGAVPALGAAWTRALELAERLGDAEYRLRSLWGLWSFQLSSCRNRRALTLALRFRALAARRAEPEDRLTGERMIGLSLFYLGDQVAARRHLERALAPAAAAAPKPPIIRFQIDQRATARAVLARVLWLQGFPDQAVRVADESVEEAAASHHAISLCYVLAHASWLALLVGDIDRAEDHAGRLLDHATRRATAVWRAIGRGHQGLIAVKRGDSVAGLALLRAAGEEIGAARPAYRFHTFAGDMAEGMAQAGQVADGLAALDEVWAWVERGDEHWLAPELLRVRGELLRLADAPGAAAAAAAQFRQALEMARPQGALAWELRAATSLARLLREDDRAAEATALLQPLYDRFSEGFDTADLKASRALLEALRQTAARC